MVRLLDLTIKKPTNHLQKAALTLMGLGLKLPPRFGHDVQISKLQVERKPIVLDHPGSEKKKGGWSSQTFKKKRDIGMDMGVS